MSQSCEYFEPLMSRMLDGDLHPSETEALRDHLRSCEACRTLGTAFSTLSCALREDLAEPPESLADDLMARIRAYEAENAVWEEPIPYIPRTGRPRKRKFRWLPTLAAACLVVVLGGTVALSSLLGSSGATETADGMDSTAYSREAGVAPAAMAEEAVLETAAEELLPEPEAMEALDQEPAEAEAAAGYTLESPASVPSGLESDFEALLDDAGAMIAGPLHTVCVVEYRGVLYEFTTDEGESVLCWHDAAEGSPRMSTHTPDELWAIFK